MTPDMDLTLLLPLVPRFWAVALLWALLVCWFEARVTRPLAGG
ncbi:hypothetical protein [Variovorax sp. KBW07]|nr:hypothetical protein [Variovorax sp. KBW07]